MNDQPQCAHARVVRDPIDWPDGTRSDRWICDSGCGTTFRPEYPPRLPTRRQRIARVLSTGGLSLLTDHRADGPA